MKYLIRIPGKEDRIIEDKINFEIVAKRIEELGGTIDIIPEPKKEFNPPKIKTNYVKTNTISFNECLEIFWDIKSIYFKKLENENVQLKLGRRSLRRLGSAYTYSKIIKINPNLLENVALLKQVIFHELCHIEFPDEHHSGINFRNKEFNNPFRTKKTRKLTCIS